jgi:hypothetical protein
MGLQSNSAEHRHGSLRQDMTAERALAIGLQVPLRSAVNAPWSDDGCELVLTIEPRSDGGAAGRLPRDPVDVISVRGERIVGVDPPGIESRRVENRLDEIARAAD